MLRSFCLIDTYEVYLKLNVERLFDYAKLLMQNTRFVYSRTIDIWFETTLVAGFYREYTETQLWEVGNLKQAIFDPDQILFDRLCSLFKFSILDTHD